MPKVFISYVRENYEAVQRLCNELKAHGIDVWLDREALEPGIRWKPAIRKAIRQGDFFIACFSTEYNARAKTHMNEELTIAIEEMRQRPMNRAWFIPIKLSECDIPDRDIGAGETLQDIQWVELYKNYDTGIQSILSVILKEPAEIEKDIEKTASLGMWLGDPIAARRLVEFLEKSIKEKGVGFSPSAHLLDIPIDIYFMFYKDISDETHQYIRKHLQQCNKCFSEIKGLYKKGIGDLERKKKAIEEIRKLATEFSKKGKPKG